MKADVLAAIENHLASIGDGRAAAAVVEFSEAEIGVMFHELPDPPEAFVRISLPSAAVVDETVPSGEYRLPKPYRVIPFGPVSPVPLNKEDAESFRKVRIADYATSKCH